MSDFPILDHNRDPYPSARGAMVQAIEVLTDPSAEPWYSYEKIDSPEEGTVYLNAISYNENGDEDKVYVISLKLEVDNDDLS